MFQGNDVNLKFNKPELQITIDRLKASELGISILDITNTLQLALSGRRFGYFIRNGKQYQVIGQVDRKDRDAPLDLKSFYVRSRNGELIQLDNLVNIAEASNPPTIYHFNRLKSATISAGLAPGRTLGEGIKEMEKIADEVLDETFLHITEWKFTRFCREFFQYTLCLCAGTCINLSCTGRTI